MVTKDILLIAKEVINTEINGLMTLKDNLDDNFIKVCNLLYKLQGRIILSGVGKSGYIGKKIASTLASTGSPAMFLHPTEALHGDLGMITKQDALIAISNSGKSKELEGIINFANRFAIPLIAVTSNPESYLAKEATIFLCLPKVVEAGSIGLAPTTSTTNLLAIGDAIAMVLLELKGFSKDDFAKYHPGGSIGTQFIQITEIMHQNKDLPLVQQGVIMQVALVEMSRKRQGCVGVISSIGELIGMITDGDLRRHFATPNFLELTVEKVMTKDIITITKDVLVGKATLIMEQKNINNMFIVEEKKPIGIIHIQDLLKIGIV